MRFNLTSTDVIHSFWIVPFEFKRDVIPDHPNHFEVTPTKTGTFIGRCTELCGLYHSRMLFRVKIVTPAQFQHVDPRSSRRSRTHLGVLSDHHRQASRPGRRARRSYRKGSILADWLSSTDHKIIGHLYLITSFGFFLVGGADGA